MKYTLMIDLMQVKARLTLTWDVLKYVSESTEYLVNTWLTLTWDVLKSSRADSNYLWKRLTLTWDVLKL